IKVGLDGRDRGATWVSRLDEADGGAMLDKARLGARFVCYVCGTKFYDLNRAVPTCPDCNADQREAPVRGLKSLLSKGGGRKRNEPDMDELEEEELDDELGGGEEEEGE